MKFNLTATAFLLAALTLTARAGTDSKDMKDFKGMAPAMVTDAGPYVAVYGGADFSNSYGDKKTVVSNPGGGSAFVSPGHVHSGPGGVGGLKVGYNFTSFPIGSSLRIQPAVEAEALYLGANAHANLGGEFTGLRENTSYNNGAFFVNGIFRLKSSSPFTPYIGAGIGAEYLTTHTGLNVGSSSDAIFTGMGGTSLDFAAQALGGFDISLSRHWSIFTEYKFIDAVGTDLKSPDIRNASGGNSGLDYYSKGDQIAQQVATAGLKYSF
jgi:opacity protein-like surface antigen